MFETVSAEMAAGTVGDQVAMKLDRTPIEEKIGKHDATDLSILLRRLGSYTFAGW